MGSGAGDGGGAMWAVVSPFFLEGGKYYLLPPPHFSGQLSFSNAERQEQYDKRKEVVVCCSPRIPIKIPFKIESFYGSVT